MPDPIAMILGRQSGLGGYVPLLLGPGPRYGGGTRPRFLQRIKMKLFYKALFNQATGNGSSPWVKIPFGVERVYISITGLAYPIDAQFSFYWNPIYFASAPETGKLPAYCREVTDGDSGAEVELKSSVNQPEDKKWFEFFVPASSGNNWMKVEITDYVEGTITVDLTGLDEG